MGEVVPGWAETQSVGGQNGGRTTPWIAVEFRPNPRLLPPPESSVFELTCAGLLRVAAVVVVAAVAACGSCPHTGEVSAGSTPDLK